MDTEISKIMANDEKYLATLNPVDRAIASRFSARAFLKTPVEQSEIEHLLEVAGWAPSGTNMQPWQVYVTSGVVQKNLYC